MKTTLWELEKRYRDLFRNIEENEVFYYKEEVQDMFNDYYDEYYTLIEKLAI